METRLDCSNVACSNFWAVCCHSGKSRAIPAIGGFTIVYYNSSMMQKTSLSIILLAFLLVAPQFSAGAKRDEILAAGLLAVNKYLENSPDLGCGWEDGTFMIGAPIRTVCVTHSSSPVSNQQEQQPTAAACSSVVPLRHADVAAYCSTRVPSSHTHEVSCCRPGHTATSDAGCRPPTGDAVLRGQV